MSLLGKLAMMGAAKTVQFVGSTKSDLTQTTYTLSLPAGTQAGDMCIVSMPYDGLSVPGNNGDLWSNERYDWMYSGNLMWRRLSQDEVTGGSITFNATQGGGVPYMVVFRNVLDLRVTHLVRANVTSITFPVYDRGFTTRGLLLFGYDRDVTAGPIVAQTGWTALNRAASTLFAQGVSYSLENNMPQDLTDITMQGFSSTYTAGATLIELLGDTSPAQAVSDLPLMTGLTTPAGYTAFGVSNAHNAFSGSTSSTVSGAIGDHIGRSYPSPITVARYGHSEAFNVSDGNFITDWVFEGSNDGTNWTALDSRVGQTVRKKGTVFRWYDVPLSGRIPFSRHRIRVTGANTTTWTIREIIFLKG